MNWERTAYSYTFRDPYSFGNGTFNGQPLPPRPYEFPTKPEEYPVIQEGDHGLIIIRQVSMGWRQAAIDDILRQVTERESQLGCQMIILVDNLEDGSLLVDWKRKACVETEAVK